MATQPTSGPGSILSQACAGYGAAAAPKRGAAAVEAFVALLGGQQGAAAPAAIPAAGPSPAGQTASGVPGGQGIAQPGASAAELTATKVRIAGGLRVLEAATLQALRAAQADGDSAKVAQILQGAAQAVGAMLGGTDAALGTDAMTRIAALLTTDGAGAAGAAPGSAPGLPGTGGAGGKDDPLALAMSMFAAVAQALGLVRPVPPGQQTAPPQQAAEPAAALATPQAAMLPAALPAVAGPRDPAPTPLRDLVARLFQSGQDAAKDAKPEAKANGASAAKVQPDPFAQLLQAGVGGAALTAAQVGAQAGAQAPAPFVPADPTSLGATTLAAATSTPHAVQAAAFAGMLGTQIRAAQPSDGVTRIALSPRGLGEIEIDMKRDSSGRLNVVLRVENPMVLAALRNDHLRLTDMFATPGGGAQPSLDFESFANRDGQPQDQGRRRAGSLAGPDSATGDVAGAGVAGTDTVWQDRIGRGALDIRT